MNYKYEGETIRLDKLFREFFYPSRSELKKVIDSKEVFVNGKLAKASLEVNTGDIIELPIYNEFSFRKITQDINVLYEDDYYIALDKPKNFLVHPAKSSKELSLVEFLITNNFPLSDGEDALRPGVIHRLDKETTGIVIFAKTNNSHELMKKMFSDRKISKRYICIVSGDLKGSREIKNYITRDDTKIKMKVANFGKEAITLVDPIDSDGFYSLLDVKILTGRTHQIRVSLADIGFPIVGDDLYGNIKNNKLCDRQMLHSYSLEFDHPITNEKISIVSKLPNDFKDCIKKIGFKKINPEGFILL